MPTGPIVGRDVELAAVDELFTGVGRSAGVLVIEGDAGIGKTTLWSEAVERARTRRYVVMATRPSKSDARLTFVGLSDLLERVPDAVLAELPAPQRRVLDVALMRADVSSGAQAQRLVSAAFLSVVRALAPVAIACDDLQWLDAASWEALLFAVRRIGSDPIVLLASLRNDADGAARRSLGGALPEHAVRRLRLGPLTLSALHRVLASELGTSFSRPALVRIEQASGGNPLFAIELGRAILESGEELSGGAPLPVPSDLRALIARRVSRLPHPAREMLLRAAAAAHPTVEMLDVDALAPAEADGLIAVAPDGKVAFRHPLYAAAVYSSASSADRRAVHTLLSDTSDLEERARHRALATVGASEPVAGLLDEAAAHAAARGAPASTAAHAELALRLTPVGRTDDVVRRTIALADALARSGEAGRPRRLLEAALRDAPVGAQRCEALSLLARLLWLSSDWPQAIPRCEEALAEASGPELLARLHVQRASMGDTDPLAAAHHARAALELLDERADPVRFGYALLQALQWEFFAGAPLDRHALEHAMRLVAAADVGTVAAGWARVVDDFATARRRYEEAVEHARQRGDEQALCEPLAHLATLECWLGDMPAADWHASESVALADQIGERALRCVALHARATVEAYRGEADSASASAEQILDLLRDAPDPTLEVMAEAVLGFVALSVGSYPDAGTHFGRAGEVLESMGWREPAPFRFQGDEIEVAIALGDLVRAHDLTRRLEERARRTPRPWVRVVAARSRALVSAAGGDLAGAERALERALTEHELLEMPLELARTLLVLGQVQRRRKEKRAARDTLERSAELFDRLSAGPWRQKARVELERVGLRRRDPDALTPTEERIALLAADGLTNREIAERAFVSPKTVEANLARAYRKLGIGSRAELGRMMAERGPAAET